MLPASAPVTKSRFGGSVTSRGFTLAELVMVLVIVSVLAVAAMPAMFGRLTFDTRRFADQVRAAMQYAQKVAVAQRRNVCVTVTANSLSPDPRHVRRRGLFGGRLRCEHRIGFRTQHAGQREFRRCGDHILSMRWARPRVRPRVTVTGDQSIPIDVEAVTGYVR